MKPICANCQREMSCEKNGQAVEILDYQGEPYQIWEGDTWRCDGCAAKVVTGFGARPVAEAHNPNRYLAIRNEAGSVVTIGGSAKW